MTYAVKVDNLSKVINGSVILNGINMKVKAGEIYGFLGANGAGKTTLMKALYRIMIPTEGSVTLLGEQIGDGGHTVFSRIGSIIETPVFFGELDAKRNLELHCDYMGAEHGRETEMLTLFGLEKAGGKPVKDFSLGMKQRLALARAFLTSPELLILDEPINGLDPQGIIEIRDLLLEINRKYHTSILISSHILDELAKIANTIGMIDCGSMIAEIAMSEIQSSGLDLETYYLELIKGVKNCETSDKAGA